MKNTDKKEIVINIIDDDKASVKVTNMCIDCVIDHMKKITTQLIKDRDSISEVTEDVDYDKVDTEDLENLLKKAPDIPSFDEAYATYKRGVKTTKEVMNEFKIDHGTIPDSVGKILSILGSDDQIRDDLAHLVAGYTINESYIKKDSKKKKKK